jgi:hypothetical protein
MRKKLMGMLILLSVLGNLYAQENDNSRGEEKVFGLPPYSIEREFWVDLGKGNQLEIQLGTMDDLDRLGNIDSLLLVFFSDMRSFKDSLTDPLSSKRIDYVTDSSGRKKIRFRQFRSSGSSFLMDQGEPAILKLEQDTINIIITTPLPEHQRRSEMPPLRYDRLRFFINNYNELEGYITGGLNNKIRLLRQKTNYNRDWTPDKLGPGAHLIQDPSISARMHKGFITPANDYLAPAVFANVQNYKNSFAPSFSLGLTVHLNHGFSLSNYHVLTTHDISLTWEPIFLFATDSQGRLQTNRNDFLVLSYTANPANVHDAHVGNMIMPAVSLGYLIRREGDYFEHNSFRITTGRVNLFRGKTFLEPCMYFHDFFRGVTPGIRLSQRF